jgi:hypothetical protein
MEALATDPSGVEYQFKVDSVLQGWQSSGVFDHTGLGVNTSHTYTVQAHDMTVDHNETDWLPVVTAYTLANAPGAVTIDMVPAPANLNGPACRSLGLKDIALNGNPDSTQIAIKVGSQWLVFNGADIQLGGAAEWHTRAEWLSQNRVRGLTPGTPYTFEAMARNGDGLETSLGPLTTETTNIDGDVNRNARTSVQDIVFVRNAVAGGGDIRTLFAWACDINDSGTATVLDIQDIRDIILGLP